MQALLTALGLGKKTAGKANRAHFSTDIEGRGDSLFLRKLTLTLEQSTLHTEVAITALRNSPAYALQTTLDSADISPVSRLFGEPELSGKVRASGKVQMQGESLADLLQSAQGESLVKLENGRLHGTNFMSGLLEKLGNYGSLMPELAAGANSNADKHTDIISLVASTSIDQGIIASKTFMVNLGKASIKGDGSFDAGQRIMDYTFNLNLDKSLFAARTENLQLPMQCRGNLAEEQLEFIEAFAADCKTDDKAINEIISKNLIKRFSGR